MADPFNQVAQGREGTGAAFILNGNRATDLFQQNIAAEEQNRRLQEFQRQKAAREQQNLIDANLGKVNLKDHWIAQDEELRTKYSDLMKYGAELKVKGVNPTSDPTFRDLNNQLDAQAAYSGQLSSGLAAYQKEISENGDKYSDESKAALAAYYDPKKPLDQYMKEGMVPPTLKPKYTLSGMLNGIKGSAAEFDGNGRIIKQADRGKNVAIAQGLQDTPAFKNFVKEQGGDPSMPAFPTKINGKTIYSTRDEVLVPMVNEYLNDIKPEEYKNFGLKATTKEEAGVELLDMIKRQNKAYGTVVAQVADQLDAGVDSSNKKDYNPDRLAISWEGLNLRKRALARQEEKDKKEETDVKYLTTLKRGVMSGDGEAMKRFNAFLQGINGQAKQTNSGLVIDIPVADKKSQDAFSQFMTGKQATEGGKKIVRYSVGKNSGQSGEILLDNILKQVDLLKKNATPDEYSGEFDQVGGDDNFDDL